MEGTRNSWAHPKESRRGDPELARPVIDWSAEWAIEQAAYERGRRCQGPKCDNILGTVE